MLQQRLDGGDAHEPAVSPPAALGAMQLLREPQAARSRRAILREVLLVAHPQLALVDLDAEDSASLRVCRVLARDRVSGVQSKCK